MKEALDKSAREKQAAELATKQTQARHTEEESQDSIVMQMEKARETSPKIVPNRLYETTVAQLIEDVSGDMSVETAAWTPKTDNDDEPQGFLGKYT